MEIWKLAIASLIQDGCCKSRISAYIISRVWISRKMFYGLFLSSEVKTVVDFIEILFNDNSSTILKVSKIKII